jgi:aminoglycoside N3'-acetyltransferase
MPEVGVAAPTPIAQLVVQLRALGVRRGGVLLVHASFRAVRPVEDGPRGLIAALREALGADGTVVMPSWTGDDSSVFDPSSTAASADLGILADTFWRLPGVERSDHPFAFAAIGPLAHTIVKGPLPLPPHIHASPVGRVYDLGGQVLLLGVDHDANTTIHLAELLADVPYRLSKHITVLRDGRPARIDYAENDHCCARFALLDTWLADVQRRGRVGNAEARLVDARAIVNAVAPRLRSEPLLFLHEPAHGCAECDEARASVG